MLKIRLDPYFISGYNVIVKFNNDQGSYIKETFYVPMY